MKIKTLYKFILQCAACWLVCACDSLFDNELPKHDLVGENAIVDEKSASTALNGAYSFLDDSKRNGGDLNSHIVIYNNIRLNMLVSTGPTSFETDQLFRMTYDETESWFENAWKIVYEMLNAANNVIFYTEKVDDGKFAPRRKCEILGEARFLRAFCNMYLLEHFAQFWDTNSAYGLVLRLEPSVLSNNTCPRVSVDSSYNAIFNDLEYAIQNGPDFYSRYRACKTTAKAFKANYLLMRGTQEDRMEALRLADEVLAGDDFKMEENYADIFKNKHASTELMFTQYTDNPTTMNDNVQGLLQLLGGGRYRVKENTPDDDLSQYYEIMGSKESERYAATLDSIYIKSEDKTKTLIINKFYTNENVAIPMYYMRLAQVYLIKAEAMSYIPDYTVGDVLDVLNILRDRANESRFDASDYSSMEEVREEIFNEYIRELGMENGDAFFYAARTMIGGQRLLAKHNPNFVKDSQLCFPIPSAELEINFKAEQNPY